MTPNPITPEPRTGDLFLCVKANRQHSAVKGRTYLLEAGELRTYTTRNVTLLANGWEMLDLPGVFIRAAVCPFCNTRVYDPPTATVLAPDHDALECAADWDARMKNYCRECNGEAPGGQCAKCYPEGD